MQKVRVPITNFQFGEVSPSLYSRTDSDIYTASAQRVENFFLRAEGGVVKRAGLENIYEYDITVERTTFTITVSDYANITADSQIKFYDADGTLYTLQSETVGSADPSASSGNIHFFRPNTSNNVTADKIYAAINAIDGFTVANPAAAVVTVTRDKPNGGTYLATESTDVSRLTVINFSGGSKVQSRLLPFIFSDDERYIISLENAKLRCFSISPSTGVVSLVSTLTADVDGAALPFSDTYLEEYTFTQAGDVMFICHPLFMPRQLVRTSLTTFQVEVFFFDVKSDSKLIYQPYYSFQGLATTLDPSKTSGTGAILTCGVDDSTADPDGISVSAQVANEANLVLGGALASSGSVTFPYGRIVTITSGGNDSGFAFTVTGTDADGIAQTEAITGGSSTIATGTKYFKTITQIASAGDPAGTVIAGVTSSSAFSYFDLTGSQSGGNYASSLHAGVTLRYHGAEIEITSVQSSTQATGTILDSLEQTLDANALRVTASSDEVIVTHVKHGLAVGNSITISDAAAVGNITAGNLNGARVITSIVDDNHYTFDAGGSANASIDGGGAPVITTHAPSSNWSEQSFSALRGYPAAITFHENRLVFAGTLSQPDSIWMSKSSRYYNFDVGDAEDNDSIQITASIGEINQIRHLVSNRDLQIFTATSEMYIPVFQNRPLTPTTTTVKRQTPFGSSFIRPQVLDGGTVFVQKGGAIVREYLFTDQELAYSAGSVSSLSSHLIKNPKEMNILYGAIDRTESYIFIVNNDGTLAVFNSNRNEKRAGWTEFTSQARFMSTVTVDDRVFANLVINTGAGTHLIFLCEFQSALNTDVSKVYTGSAGVFDVSATYANGAVVDVINGNNYLGQFTVASGDVDVSAVELATVAEIGLKFEVNLITNPIDMISQSGPVTGEPRSLASVVVDLNTTLSVSVNGTNLLIRQVTDDFSLQQQPVTGKKEFRLLGYNRDPQVTISQSAPLPMQVNGLIAELVF